MIYVAAPLFSLGEREFINNLVYDISRELNLDPLEDFYVPHRDNTSVIECEIYDENMKNLNNCDIMIAILDGQDTDSGTAFEIGYFESQNKVILGLLTDTRSYNEGEFNKKLNTMIYGSLNYGMDVFNDFDYLVDELYDVLIED